MQEAKNSRWLRHRHDDTSINRARHIFARVGVRLADYDHGWLHTSTWEQLVDQRKQLSHALRTLLDQVTADKRELTEEENKAGDFCHDLADCIKYEMDWRDEIGNRGPTSLNSALLPGDQAQRQDGTSDGHWRTKDGRAVHVLTRDQRVCDITPQDDQEQQGLRFPQLLRAMVLGPTSDAERRALSEGTDATGGFAVNARLSAQLIDRMRARTRVVQAGAVTVPLETLTTKIARIAADPTVSWKAENSQLSDSNMTFESVTFTSRTLMALVRASRELLEDSVNAEEALMAAFSGAMATELDRVALYGSGSAPEPAGLANTSGVSRINVSAGLTNWDYLVDAVIKVMASNAKASTAGILHPNTLGVLAKMKDSQNNYLKKPDILQNLPLLDTTSVSLDDGGSPSATSIFIGDYSELMIGVRSQLRIEVLRERYADFLQYGFIAFLRADIQVKHPASFCRLAEIENVPNP